MDKDSMLTGKLLLAMPGIGDPRFKHAVIYICAHDENGAMGLVINHELPNISFKNLLGQLGFSSDIKIDLEKLSTPVMQGGPVEAERGFLLHSGDFARDETVKIDDAISVTGTTDALEDLLTGRGPQDALFVLGYAGWTAGQLESELTQNAWLLTEASAEIVFHADHAEKWNLAVKGLGFDPAMLSTEAGRA